MSIKNINRKVNLNDMKFRLFDFASPYAKDYSRIISKPAVSTDELETPSYYQKVIHPDSGYIYKKYLI